jgi:hypothetical protein
MDDIPLPRLYWEIIADQIAAEGWSYGFIAMEARDFEGWKVDARKGDQHHYVIAEDLNTAFLELQTSIRASR